jgi:hypothetical protein
MKRQAYIVIQGDQPIHTLRRVYWEELKRISLYLFSAKAKDAILCDPLAEANGNDPYKLALMIFIHCRHIYGADIEAKNEALAETLPYRTHRAYQRRA